CICFVCFSVYRDLYSFPTRRSSDLTALCISGQWNRRRPFGRQSWLLPIFVTRAHPLLLWWNTNSFNITSGSLKFALIMRKTCFGDRKSTRLNSSHVSISYAVFCLKK